MKRDWTFEEGDATAPLTPLHDRARGTIKKLIKDDASGLVPIGFGKWSLFRAYQCDLDSTNFDKLGKNLDEEGREKLAKRLGIPFLSEELWHVIGHEHSIHSQTWLEYNEDAIKVDEVEIVVQINGKIKSRLQISANLNEEEIKKLVFADQHIKEIIANKTIRKIFVVPGKLVNIVIKT